MDSNLQEHSPNQSDSDDWTLVSFKSPTLTSTSANRSQHEAEADPEKPQAKSIDDDNLIEVDLEQSSDSTNSSFDRLNDELTPEEQHRTSNDLVVPGFQALDTTDDGEISQPTSRHSSVSRLDRDCSESNRNLSRLTSTVSDTNCSLLTCRRVRQMWQNEEFGDAEESESETEEREFLYDSSIRQNGAARARIREREHVKIVTRSFFNLLFVTLVAMLLISFWHFIGDLQELNKRAATEPTPEKLEMEFSRYSDDSDINIAPELYAELQIVDDELSRCVKRQNPSWYNYYMSEERFKESESKPQLSMKHYNGLVCYGQETQWRERFNRLREEKKLDLSKIMQKAKRAVANDLLAFYHPSLQFKLILNQLEYLEFLENKRNKKQSDATIKYLKVENMQLYRQLNNNPLKSEASQKLTKGLEWENLSMRRELDALRARMNIKAGPSYIRQSQELEQYERENVLLKHFLYDVSREVSVISKHFNLHTIDASINLNDLEVLKFHTKTTKEYLKKLSTKIGNVLAENIDLKEELSHNYMLNTVNKSISPAIRETEEQENFIMKNNHSEVLMKDNCMQNLLKIREQAAFLQNENKYLRNCCKGTSDQSVAAYQDSSLNSTRKIEPQESIGLHRQIAALATGLEKRIRSAVALVGSRSFEEFSLFLEEFGNRIKSTSLVPQESVPPEQSNDLPDTLPEVIESIDSSTKPDYAIGGINTLSTPSIEQMYSIQEELTQNTVQMPSRRNSWFFNRAMQRTLLRSTKYFEPNEFSSSSSNDKLGKETSNLDHRNNEKRNSKHTFVDPKIKHRKSRKSTAQKNRKMKRQKYSRSEL